MPNDSAGFSLDGTGLMRLISIIVLWLATGAIVFTLFGFGMVDHYWYANDQGQGYDFATWKGYNLDDVHGYEKGFRFRYSFPRFEKNAEMRIILIIVVLASAWGGTVLLITRFPKSNTVVKT